jgi:uncharacterized protein YecE (DUF72 family)
MSADFKLYISTMGHVYQHDDGDFYPRDLPEDDRLSFYASKFNSITIKSTFFGQPKTDLYETWLENVKDNESFQFVLAAPKLMTHAKSIKDVKKAWSFFWDGIDHRGGCRVLHDQGKLGCILLEFANTFYYSPRNANRLKALKAIIPKTIRVAFEFRHWSWWENKKILTAIFEQNKNWCVSTPYIENGLVKGGWAGNLPSTRISHKVERIPTMITTDFVFLNFHGTMGPQLGSYDNGLFLENIALKMEEYKKQGVSTIYCSFNNTDSSYCFPLPATFVMGLNLRPKLKDLPDGQEDLPCCLHDALRLTDLRREIDECPYQLDARGHVKLVFDF